MALFLQLLYIYTYLSKAIPIFIEELVKTKNKTKNKIKKERLLLPLSK